MRVAKRISGIRGLQEGEGPALHALPSSPVPAPPAEREPAHPSSDLAGARARLVRHEERLRIARDVHDGVAQLASATYLNLLAFAERHRSEGEAGAELDRILALAEQTVGEARRVVANLRPSDLEDLGLATAIRRHVERLREEGWQVGYEESLGGERLAPAVETALFRVAQEALTNVRKHAATVRVEIALDLRPGAVSLRVRDYGRGFDPERAAVLGGIGTSVGLSSMSQRVAQLGGAIDIDSRPGAGTVLTAVVPAEATP